MPERHPLDIFCGGWPVAVAGAVGRRHRRPLIHSTVQSGGPVRSVLDSVSMNLLFPIGEWMLPFVVVVFPAVFILIARHGS